MIRFVNIYFISSKGTKSSTYNRMECIKLHENPLMVYYRHGELITKDSNYNLYFTEKSLIDEQRIWQQNRFLKVFTEYMAFVTNKNQKMFRLLADKKL